MKERICEIESRFKIVYFFYSPCILFNVYMVLVIKVETQHQHNFHCLYMYISIYLII
jgi:hypothetical protein